MTQIQADVTNYVLRRKGVGEKIGDFEGLSNTGLKVIRNDNPLPWNSKYVFRWGTTSNVPKANDDQVIVNKASAIHWAFDKRTSRKVFADNNLSMSTWIDFGKLLHEFQSCMEHPDIDGWVWNHNWPLIVRPESHIRSMDMEVCNSLEEVYTATQKFKKYYISEYIKKDREFRVLVVSGRVIAMIEKIPEDKNEVSWGCVTEGKFKYIPWDEWPLEAAGKAIEAMRLSGLDFGAVDVIRRSTGLTGPEDYVLEINTAPELTPYYMKCFVKAFDYIVKNGTKVFEYDKSSWKGLIHPAISNMAKIEGNAI